MEGVNCDIENWSVSQVLSWLKSTNDGQFDQFVPIFRDHEIYGDALLSLTNDILRDELAITAYGSRHALLKAIQNLRQSYQSRQELQSKLKNIKFNINRSQPHHIHNKNKNKNKLKIHKSHRKGSMSSVTSKASVNTRTSHTYCVGDLQRENSDTIAGIDDNWENLNTKAKLGVVDASEYLKQAKLIVKAVTGTTIKLTRKGSDDGCDNIYKSGFFEFEDNIPNWTTIDLQTAIKYEWNIRKLAWDKSYITVKIAENPFSRGSLRVSYYCLDLTEPTNGTTNNGNSNNHRFNHKSFDLTSLHHDGAGVTPKNNNNNSTTPKSLRSMKSPSAHSLSHHGSSRAHIQPISKSDKIAIKGFHSKSNGNLKAVAFQHQNIAKHAVSSNDNDNNNMKIEIEIDSKLESMSVPADVALGRHHLQHSSGDISPPVPDNLPFPFFSPSLPEAEDEKIDSSQSQLDQDRLIHHESPHEEKSMEVEEEKLNEVESSMNRMNIPILSPTPHIMSNNNMSNHGNDNISTIEENEEKSRDSNSHTFTANTVNTIATISTKTNLQKDDLVARLLGFENRYGGTLIVAKQSIDLTESVQTYFNDVRTQSVAQLFANEYNKYNPPKKVAFIKASVIQLLESESEQFFCVEDYLHGAYMKHLDNYGGDEGIRNTPSAFAHFTYEASQHRLLVCDIQGVGDVYTDPQVHSSQNVKAFGRGNLGTKGFENFLRTHRCNPVCKYLKLENINKLPIKQMGTLPANTQIAAGQISTVPFDFEKSGNVPLLSDKGFPKIVEDAEESRSKGNHNNDLTDQSESTSCWSKCIIL